MAECDLHPKTRNVVITDEQMAETDERVTNLFTKKNHHRDMSVLYLVHNLFPEKKGSRDTSLNSQYMVVFKNPRDASQMSHLARQMHPGRVKFVQGFFKDATSVPYKRRPRVCVCARPSFQTTAFNTCTCRRYKKTIVRFGSFRRRVLPQQVSEGHGVPIGLPSTVGKLGVSSLTQGCVALVDGARTQNGLSGPATAGYHSFTTTSATTDGHHRKDDARTPRRDDVHHRWKGPQRRGQGHIA